MKEAIAYLADHYDQKIQDYENKMRGERTAQQAKRRLRNQIMVLREIRNDLKELLK